MKDKIIAAALEAGIEFQQHQGITGRVRTTTCGSQAIEKMERFYAIAYRAGMERAAEIAADVDEPGWTGYECPNTFDDGRRAAVDAIQKATKEQT